MLAIAEEHKQDMEPEVRIRFSDSWSFFSLSKLILGSEARDFQTAGRDQGRLSGERVRHDVLKRRHHAHCRQRPPLLQSFRE